MSQRRNYGPPPKPPSKAVGVVVLCIVVFIAFMMAMAAAAAQDVPPPCVDLAARENHPLPTTEAEARAAKRKVFRLVLKRDPMAIACWRAINMELSK
jgi:hypothetical protein